MDDVTLIKRARAQACRLDINTVIAMRLSRLADQLESILHKQRRLRRSMESHGEAA